MTLKRWFRSVFTYNCLKLEKILAEIVVALLMAQTAPTPGSLLHPSLPEQRAPHKSLSRPSGQTCSNQLFPRRVPVLCPAPFIVQPLFDPSLTNQEVMRQELKRSDVHRNALKSVLSLFLQGGALHFSCNQGGHRESGERFGSTLWKICTYSHNVARGPRTPGPPASWGMASRFWSFAWVFQSHHIGSTPV